MDKNVNTNEGTYVIEFFREKRILKRREEILCGSCNAYSFNEYSYNNVDNITLRCSLCKTRRSIRTSGKIFFKKLLLILKFYFRL